MVSFYLVALQGCWDLKIICRQVWNGSKVDHTGLSNIWCIWLRFFKSVSGQL